MFEGCAYKGCLVLIRSNAPWHLLAGRGKGDGGIEEKPGKR